MDRHTGIMLCMISALLIAPISIQTFDVHAWQDGSGAMHKAQGSQVTHYTSNVVWPVLAIPAHAETDSELSVMTDKSEYIPGETVRITGQTDTTLPFEGFAFRVVDPTGSTIVSGNLFPINGKFSTSVFMTTIQPAYGTYTVTGTYSDQAAMATFVLVPDSKEDELISLHTDKEVYGLGETVSVTGRLNDLWVGSLDITVQQTRNIALGTGGAAGGTAFKILDVVRLEGDGRFKYEFAIPDGNAGLGDYWIKVSQSVGSAAKSILVSKEPDMHEQPDTPISVSTDRTEYSPGDSMLIDGKIADPDPSPNPETNLVKLSISKSSDGIMLREFTAIPEPSGRFAFETSMVSTAYAPGQYTLVATHKDLAASATFEVVDSLAEDWAGIQLDKAVYGLNETVHLTGTLPPRGEHTVAISIIKPDGAIVNSGAVVDSQKFSWKWQTPISEVQPSIKGHDDRSVLASNIGIYKVMVSSGTFKEEILFKVSTSPETDSIPQEQLEISIEKSVYSLGEDLEVSGTILAREQRASDTVIPDRVRVTVAPDQFSSRHIHEAMLYPDRNGNFETTFKIPANVFNEGRYNVKATYIDLAAEVPFDVVNDFTIGTDGDVTFLLATDKAEYGPGELVTMTGNPSRLAYIEGIKIGVIKESKAGTDCGPLLCGNQYVPATGIMPNPTGSFAFEFRLDDSPYVTGTYEIIADTVFETKSVTFKVLADTTILRPDRPEVEKASRIPDAEITVRTASKVIEDGTVYPRTLSGSLVTPLPTSQFNVNLMVSHESGTCVVGPHIFCHIQESTGGNGTDYEMVEIDGMPFKVRYNGPDARVEKFEILPHDMFAALPESDWEIQALKDGQWSRFYYKVELW